VDTLWYAERAALDSWRARGISTLLTPPGVEPVTLDLFRKHARLPPAEDAIAWHYLITARAWLEDYTGLAFVNQTWATTFEAFPSGAAAILLPKAPLVSVTSVKSYSPTDVESTMDPLTYFVDATRRRILLHDGIAWPTGLRIYNGIVVTYVAGYGTSGAAVPIELRHAISVLAAHWYEHREASTDLKLDEIPFGVRALVDRFRLLTD